MIPAALANTGIAWTEPERQVAFERWLASLASHRLDPASLRAASADASFRRYLRIEGAQGTLIVMDAPPPQEDVRPFVHVAQLIEQAGLNAPRVLAQDIEHGFLLLTDLGSRPYLAALHDALARAEPNRADALMREAFAALVQWQLRVEPESLPPYDAKLLRRELALFTDWCVQREHGITWNAAQQAQWQRACDLLVASALAQPRVAVHRDYMARNLMLSEPNPGILDFQDAALGPVTYDAASLLRDAFISWSEEQELDWAVRYWQQASQAGLPLDADFGEFWRQLEWMGLQRHLKVLGIFCRLKHRDGKPAYSADLPRFLRYARRVASRYRDLALLLPLLDEIEGLETRVGHSF
jgi:aminoglycoside/choline kinase family phosphotransferase